MGVQQDLFPTQHIEDSRPSDDASKTEDLLDHGLAGFLKTQ